MAKNCQKDRPHWQFDESKKGMRWKMNWYLYNGENSDIVKSTKIKFSRNLSEFKFNLKSKEEIEKLENKVKENLYNIGYGLKFLKLQDMDEITKMSLVEKGLMNSNFAIKRYGSILINDEENICIMIGGENHLEIQVFNAGLDLENTLNLAIELDEKIGETLGYAVSKKYGYLTSTLNNIGTGLKASVIVHLPALAKTRNTRKVFDAIGDFGISIKEVYKGKSDIYQISNKHTLGISEKEIVKNLKVIVQTVIEQERQARKLIAKDEIGLSDLIYRSFGILSNCRKISNEETRELLSNIKLGVDLGILDELTDVKVQKLYLYSKPANLQKYLGQKYDKEELEIKRAEVIKQIIKEN